MAARERALQSAAAGGSGEIKKVIIQRESSCTFQVLIEVISSYEIRIHHDLRTAVDEQLENEHRLIKGERRWIRTSDGAIMTDL